MLQNDLSFKSESDDRNLQLSNKIVFVKSCKKICKWDKLTIPIFQQASLKGFILSIFVLLQNPVIEKIQYDMWWWLMISIEHILKLAKNNFK